MIDQPKALLFGVGLALSCPLFAQTDSTRHLQEVVIEQTRLTTYRATAYTGQTDSAQRTLLGASSVADLLRRTGVGQMRFYGPAGLATASMRGSGSNHTAILWNGIPLASPLNGQLDLSLLPVSLFEETTVESGGAASLYGSGSIGGTIHLNNHVRFREGTRRHAQTAFGSFGNFFQDAGVRWSGSRWHMGTRFFLNRATNDFPFHNTSVFPSRFEIRQHNAFDLYGWLHQTYWQLRPRQLLSVKWWRQQSNYEVPNPITVPRPGQARENNDVNRLLSNWQLDRSNWNLFFQSAFLHHRLIFTDPVIGLNATSIAQSFINQAEINQTWKKNLTTTGGLNYTWEQGRAQEISALPQRHRVAGFYAAKWSSGHWQLNGSTRLELMDGATMPLAPALNAVWTPNRVWQFTASAARNYRIPTFNDLYWVGTGAVGNPQLQSETARAFDFVIKSNLLTTTHRQLHVQAAGFSNQVENWILWAPLEYNLWRPDNLKCVWSRGVEAQARWKQSFAKDNSWSWHLQYRYTRATNQELYETHNANELYKQLPFTPQHEGSATAQWRYRQTGLQLVHAITGPQFTDGDNTRFLAMPGYQLTNVWISQAIHRGATHWRITAEFNNLFDVDYVARPGFPMPGRNYRIMVQFELKNEKRDE